MTTLQEITKMTEIDRVVMMVAKAANRMKRLEAESELAFPEWVKAQEAADKAGLPVGLNLGSGMQTALADYKRRLEAGEAKMIVDQEFGNDVVRDPEEKRPVWDQEQNGR